MKLGIRDFTKSLSQVIMPEDKIIVIFSGIWLFGHRFAIEPKKLPDILLDLIIEFVGSDRTLIMPAYTNYFAKTLKFDLIKSKPQTGVLPEGLLSRHNSIRSLSAMNSYVAVGSLASDIGRLKGKTLWGEGSVKEWLQQQNARICVLGVPWHRGCGFLHRSEEILQIPYRYYKVFSGEWSNDGNDLKPCTETMYVSPRDVHIALNYAPITNIMNQKGIILKNRGSKIPIESAKAQDIINVSLELLRSDPYACVTNKEEIKKWAKHGKNLEIKKLKVNARSHRNIETKYQG